MRRIVSVAAVAGLVVLGACDSGEDAAAPTTEETSGAESTETESSEPEASTDEAAGSADAGTQSTDAAGSADADAEAGTGDPPAGPPVLTEAAIARTEAGATSFVQFYFDTLNYAMRNPEPELLDTWGVPLCTVCVGFEETLAQLVEDEMQYDNDVAVVREVNVDVTDNTGMATVIVDLPAANLVDSEGTVVETREAESEVEVLMELQHVSGAQWRIFWMDGIEL